MTGIYSAFCYVLHSLQLGLGSGANGVSEGEVAVSIGCWIPVSLVCGPVQPCMIVQEKVQTSAFNVTLLEMNPSGPLHS